MDASLGIEKLDATPLPTAAMRRSSPIKVEDIDSTTLEDVRCLIDHVLTYSVVDDPSRPQSKMGGPFDGAPQPTIALT
jgi:hypothetical protein